MMMVLEDSKRLHFNRHLVDILFDMMEVAKTGGFLERRDEHEEMEIYLKGLLKGRTLVEAVGLLLKNALLSANGDLEFGFDVVKEAFGEVHFAEISAILSLFKSYSEETNTRLFKDPLLKKIMKLENISESSVYNELELHKLLNSQN